MPSKNYETAPHQRAVAIHKVKQEKDFLQIKNSHWMEFNKKYGPYALQLYLYLAKNADGYEFALSQKTAEKEAGICKSSFHKYVGLLIKNGYLVPRNRLIFDFYEIPYGKEKEKSASSDEPSSLSHEQKSLSSKSSSSPQVSEIPLGNKEIHNVQRTHNKDNIAPAPQVGAGARTWMDF